MTPFARLCTTMEYESRAIHSTLSWLDAQQAAIQTVVDMLIQCQGKVGVTGMGKIGHVGARFAATLASTGTPAFFLHPAEAQHGDLGMLTDSDVLVACSNSGKTREVCETVNQAKRAFPNLFICVVSAGEEQCELRQLAHISLRYPAVTEACPLELVPTASIAVVGALLDGLALAVMEQRGFSREDYAKRHHGGYLGEKARQEA